MRILLRCDLIAMGAHGRTLLGQAMLGSAALKVLHAAEVPVQLVRLTGPARNASFTTDEKPASAGASGRGAEVEART